MGTADAAVATERNSPHQAKDRMMNVFIVYAYANLHKRAKLLVRQFRPIGS
jgi:hypothetical protein